MPLYLVIVTLVLGTILFAIWCNFIISNEKSNDYSLNYDEYSLNYNLKNRMRKQRSLGKQILPYGYIAISISVPLIFGFLYTLDYWHRPAITFAGKVTNSYNREWPNERLVLLFLKGQEIGRSFTELGEFPQSKDGIHDGLFVIGVSNPYELNDSDFRHPQGREVSSNWTWDYYYHWFPEIEEGSLTTIPVPSKNVEYVIKVLAGDRSTLPTAILNPGSTSLDQNNTIVVSLTMSDTGPMTGDVQRALADTNIQAIEYSEEPQTIDINRITVPLNNCGGSAKLTQQYIQSQTFIHEYQSEVGGRAGLNMPLGWVSLILELETKYGYKQGQIDERTINTTLIAEPETNQSYLITWQEVWESGTGTAVVGEDTLSIPFRVRTNVIHSISSEKLSC